MCRTWNAAKSRVVSLELPTFSPLFRIACMYDPRFGTTYQKGDCLYFHTVFYFSFVRSWKRIVGDRTKNGLWFFGSRRSIANRR